MSILAPAGGGKIVTLRTHPGFCGRAARGLLVALTFILYSGTLLAAQTEETSDRELSLTEVRSLRHQVESSSAPEEGQQKQLLELYDRAIADLESANQAQVQIQRHEHERTRIQSRVAALRIELGRLQDRVDSSLPDDLNAERLETALAREQSLLGSLRVALRDVQELAAERLRRRNEVAQRLGTLDQEIESINAELREASELIGSDELRQAARTRALARRAALVVGSDEATGGTATRRRAGGPAPLAERCG